MHTPRFPRSIPILAVLAASLVGALGVQPTPSGAAIVGTVLAGTISCTKDLAFTITPNANVTDIYAEHDTAVAILVNASIPITVTASYFSQEDKRTVVSSGFHTEEVITATGHNSGSDGTDAYGEQGSFDADGAYSIGVPVFGVPSTQTDTLTTTDFGQTTTVTNTNTIYPTFPDGAVSALHGNVTAKQTNLTGSITQSIAVPGYPAMVAGHETCTWTLQILVLNGQPVQQGTGTVTPTETPTATATPLNGEVTNDTGTPTPSEGRAGNGTSTATPTITPTRTLTATATATPACGNQSTSTGNLAAPSAYLSDSTSAAKPAPRNGAAPGAVCKKSWLIVGLGDSVASGEGSPDGVQQVRSKIVITVNDFRIPILVPKAIWDNEECHRSKFSFEAMTANLLQQANPSVTLDFVPLACTGASIEDGMLNPYREKGIPAQVDSLKQLESLKGTPDIVLLSVGANDIGFDQLLELCGNPLDNPPVNGTPPCFTPYEQQVQARLQQLSQKYEALAVRLNQLGIDRQHVFITEYYDPTRDARGNQCRSMFPLAMNREEIRWMYQVLVQQLNTAIEATAKHLGWQYVGDIVNELGFKNHGYCANDQRWVRTVWDSYAVQGDLHGTLHPNEAGQCYIAQQVLSYIGATPFAGLAGSHFRIGIQPCGGRAPQDCPGLSPDNVLFLVPGTQSTYVKASDIGKSPQNAPYYPLDKYERPTGVLVKLTSDTIYGGTDATINPPGWPANNPGKTFARGHLLGKQLGGSGSDPWNIVTLYQKGTNTPLMTGVENYIARRVKSGDTIYFRVVPHYSGAELIPIAVELEAVGPAGFYLHAIVTNKAQAALTAGPPDATCSPR